MEKNETKIFITENEHTGIFFKKKENGLIFFRNNKQNSKEKLPEKKINSFFVYSSIHNYRKIKKRDHNFKYISKTAIRKIG